MLSRRRLPLLLAFPALYVGVAAARNGDTRPSAWLLVGLAVVVALVGGRVPDSVEPSAARIRIGAAAGLSIAIATAAVASRSSWSSLVREIGTFLAMLAALEAMVRFEGDVGLSRSASEASAPPGFGARSIHRVSIAVLILTWGAAAIGDGLAAFGAAPRGFGAEVAPVIAAVSGGVALFVLGGAALLGGAARGLELAVRPRALACAGAAAGGLLFAVALAIASAVPADAAAALGGAIAAAIIVGLARTPDALGLTRNGRKALTLLVFGGPVVTFAAIVAPTGHSGALALLLSLVALLVGAFSSKLEEPFLPMKGVLLDALRDARDSAREREAREAMAHALVRVREACAIGLGPTAAPSPELWLLHPTRVITANAAGYLQERTAELPPGIFDVALGEPHGTLRTSVLRALEVRRADLRPLLAWLEQREAICATVITESNDPDGLLVIPAGARSIDLSLDEVHAAKQLADAFVAVAQATSARERHLAREQDLMLRLDALDDDAARLRYRLDLEAGRHTLASARLGRPATVGIYSAASRMAYDALERRLARNAPTVVVARAGIDPIPYVARAHLTGPRKQGPLVVVDGTSSREHEVERWTDERTSPLALADGGLLFLVDGAALPREVQVLIARTVAERRPPWDRAAPLDMVLALSTTRPLDALGELAPELASRFDDEASIVLPGLRDRPEDLRSIVADRLAREGLRVRGVPVGIDSAAFARLVEYAFPGEDAELAAIVTRLVASTSGDVVKAADVDALGLVFSSEEPAPRRWPRSVD